MMTAQRSASSRESSPSIWNATPIVFIVDDDISVRESLESLIACAGWRAEAFASAQEFLARPRAPTPSCLVLDVGLPDLNGLELQKRVADRIAVLPRASARLEVEKPRDHDRRGHTREDPRVPRTALERGQTEPRELRRRGSASGSGRIASRRRR